MRRGGRQSFINRFMGDEDSESIYNEEQKYHEQNEFSQMLTQSQIRANHSFNSHNPFEGAQDNEPHDKDAESVAEDDEELLTSNNLTNIFVDDNRIGGTSSIGGAPTSNNASILLQQQNNNFVQFSTSNNNDNLHNNTTTSRLIHQRTYGIVDSSDFEADQESEQNDREQSITHDNHNQSSQQQLHTNTNMNAMLQQERRRRFEQEQQEIDYATSLVQSILASHQMSQLEQDYNLQNQEQSTNRNTNDTQYGNIDPSFLRDAFELIEHQRQAVANDNSINSSAVSRTYESFRDSNLYNYASHMQHGVTDDDEQDDDHYYYEEDNEGSQNNDTYTRYNDQPNNYGDAINSDDYGYEEEEQYLNYDGNERTNREGYEDEGLNNVDEQAEQEMQEQIDQDEEDEDSDQYREETELEKYLRDVHHGQARAKTAPLKPQKHTEQFKMTPGFSQLEQAAVCAVQLVQRSDLKFDLDSYEGQNSCKKFLSHIEKLCESIDVKCSKRQYRAKFSNAYRVLYKEGKLCYLTEILDSAQEAFPYLWVNGEKYVFSKEVIDAGRNLFNNFCKILYQIKDAYQRICEEQTYESLMDILNEVREYLEEFDQNWVTYEQLYVIELMLIESDARRFITEAIEIEKEITSAEVRERAKGKIMVECKDYNKNRGKLIEIINKINSVANPEGKGRDDLQAEILFQAEGLCRRVSSTQSKAVRKLAEAIRKSFQNIRQLLRKYEENIEGVDPQLKNNADLVQALVEFEQSWEKGKSYFINAKKCAQLLHFTSMIEGTAEKYKTFQEQIDDRDTVIFVTIPALLILKNLDEDDKGICEMFFPPMFEEQKNDNTKDNHEKDGLQVRKKYLELKSDYIKFRQKSKNQYDFYNIVEKAVLEMEGEESNRINEEQLLENGMCKDDLQKIVQYIRVLSMQLQRHNPADWNEFLDVALDN